MFRSILTSSLFQPNSPVSRLFLQVFIATLIDLELPPSSGPYVETKLPEVEFIESDDEDALLRVDEDELLAEDVEVGQEDEDKLLAADGEEVEQDKEKKDEETEIMVSAEEVKKVELNEIKVAKFGLIKAEETETTEENEEQSITAEVAKETSATDQNGGDKDAVEDSMEVKESSSQEPITQEPPSPDTLTIMATGEDKFGVEEETEGRASQLSDLSLSDDELSSKDWVVLSEANTVEETKPGGQCSKCDSPHPVGGRCTYLLRGASRGRPRARGRDREARSIRPKVTLGGRVEYCVLQGCLNSRKFVILLDPLYS